MAHDDTVTITTPTAMTGIESLRKEFEQETKKTRPHLERLPEEKLDWRPHEKSFTAGGLASHLVECVSWAGSIFGADDMDVNPATYTPFNARSIADLLTAFDENVARGKQVLLAENDEMLVQPWRLKIGGKTRFERSKAEVFRDFTLSHLIHHRGQFSVYLRLLNVSVPGTYGPSADEQF
jgi:uncharacterized damage-inducible protein DinB